VKKLIVCILAATLFVVSSTKVETVESVPQQAASQPRISAAQIPQLQCGTNLGTGVIVAPRLVTTAEHVMAAGGCQIKENSPTKSTRRTSVQLTEVSRQDENDFALLHARRDIAQRAIVINCSPMVTGETYWLVGYAHGHPVLEINTGTASDRYFHGRSPDGSITRNLRAVHGRSHQGMSGGPVFNARGEAVGFISSIAMDGSNRVLVKEFGDTSVCERADK
jgi:S1-C subfamily serine protease